VPGKKFLGLFATGNMDLEWTGPLAATYPGPAATACSESNPTRPLAHLLLGALSESAMTIARASDPSAAMQASKREVARMLTALAAT